MEVSVGHGWKPLRVRYRNWTGVERERVLLPLKLYWGSTKHHPEEQWILRALDLEKGEERDFAMLGILEVLP